MEFSEAIRDGKRWGDVRTSYENGCLTCAIGGAVRAVLGRDDSRYSANDVELCLKLWPHLEGMRVECPMNAPDSEEGPCRGSYEEVDCGFGNPAQIASHLYSDHKFSKDAVAVWMESVIEKKLEPKPMEVPSADESVGVADPTTGEPEPGQVASPATLIR